MKLSALLLEPGLSWMRATPVGLFVISSLFVCLSALFLRRSRPSKLNLPVFEVRDEVVKTIEEAHKKVCL